MKVAGKLGIKIDRTTICGGGAKSRLWCRIIANVLGIDVDMPALEEGPSQGAAMLAMVACKEYDSVKAAVDAIVKVSGTIHPDKEIAARYDRRYNEFAGIYPALKNVFASLA